MNEIDLRSVAHVITKGTTPSSLGSEFTPSGINFVKSESIGSSKYLNDSIFEHIDEETDFKLKRSRLESEDLLFSIAGAYLGKIAIVRKENLPANTNQAVGIVRLKKEIANADYVYYYFSQKHINSYINQLSSQSSQPNLNLDLLGRLKFRLREINEQKKIATVLSALDAKIELNNRINAELESLAKTIYDYWFVQFDFPNADGKPYKSSGGEMVYVEGGGDRAIPAGWEIKTLGEVLTIVRGASPRPIDDFLSDKGLPWIKISDATSSSNRFITETKQFITQEGISGTRRIPPNTLILSNSATLGLPRIVKIDAGVHDGWLIILNYTNGLTQEFMYNYFLFEHLKIVCLGNGSIFKNLKTEYVKGLKIVLPPKHILNIASEKFKTISELMFVRTQENQQLTQLRDWLLPMLMNGQVSIK